MFYLLIYFIYIFKYIRHINPLMFDVIDDKHEGFIMYKHEPVGRGFVHYHINHERVYMLKIRGANLHEGFIYNMYVCMSFLDIRI